MRTLAVALGLLTAVSASASEISGPARIIDGDTIEIAGRSVRLASIDAPERAQRCEADGKLYPCGEEATRALAALIAGKSVRCEQTGTDRYRRTLAVCWVGQTNLNREMVRAGWAVSYLSAEFSEDERHAEKMKRGMWSGEFTPPSEFRRKQSDMVNAAPPPGATATARGAPLAPQNGPSLETAICAASMLSGSVSLPQLKCFFDVLTSLPANQQRATSESEPLRLPRSVNEVGEMAIKCWHPSARFVAVEVIESPWRAQHREWNATRSLLMVVHWHGAVLNTPYRSLVGLIERHGQMRAILVEEQPLALPPSGRCVLNSWVVLEK